MATVPKDGYKSPSDFLKERKLKCTVAGMNLQPCDLLMETVEGYNPTGKKAGLFLWQTSNLETDTRRKFAGVKSGDHRQKGMIFNFCPFCGERIDEMIQ